MGTSTVYFLLSFTGGKGRGSFYFVKKIYLDDSIKGRGCKKHCFIRREIMNKFSSVPWRISVVVITSIHEAKSISS